MIAVALLFFLVAALCFHLGAPLWQQVFAAALFLFSLVGLVELRCQRLELDREELRFVNSFRLRTIPKADIDSVTWAKGAGVSIRLKSGEWVRLPAVGPFSSQGLTNSIRAWLRRES